MFATAVSAATELKCSSFCLLGKQDTTESKTYADILKALLYNLSSFLLPPLQNNSASVISPAWKPLMHDKRFLCAAALHSVCAFQLGEPATRTAIQALQSAHLQSVLHVSRLSGD